MRAVGDRRGGYVSKTIQRVQTFPLLPEINDVTRREFLIGAAGLLLLPAGCGSGEGVNGASREMRAVEHVAGTTEVPVSPQRIVSLDPHTMLDCVVALGFEPVGIGTIPGVGEYAPWLEGEVPEDVEGVLTGDYAPNLEKIATLEPDLILGWDYQEQSYDELSEVAPTVMISYEEHFGEHFERIGEATGRGEEAREVLDRYEERAASVREKVEGTKVSVVRPMEGEIWLYGPLSPPGGVLADLGIEAQPIPEDTESNYGYGVMSLEFIPELTGEHVFLIAYSLEENVFEEVDEAAVEELLSGPLWQRLEAVREGRVHPVQGLAWTNHGPLGAMRIIDDVEQALAGGR
jgi:iron complex transport system substrate-binding protein